MYNYGYYSNNSLYVIATILLVVAIIFSMWANSKVKRTYRKYSDSHNSRGLTGMQAARLILDSQRLRDVSIFQTEGVLTDYYNPQRNTVVLGQNEYNSTSTVAVGVAAHECGHAMQYAENYLPAKIRTAIVPVTNFGAKISWPLIMIGVILSAYIPALWQLVYVGIALFSLSTLFQLVTLPTEFDASRRALKAISENNLLEGEDYEEAKEVLTAAALTYLAALTVSFAQLLRIISIYGRKNNN